jgi:DNA primase
MESSSFNPAALPLPRHFYERELGRLGPERRGWAQGRCPFHNSKSGRSFSVNLSTGGFYCHGCGARGGDVISFVRLRDGCGFVEACKQLGSWRRISPAERVEIARRTQERAWNRQYETQQAEGDRRERLQLRTELHTTAKVHAELNNRLHRAGPSGNESEKWWGPLPSTLDCLRQDESDYCRAAKLEDPWAL